MRYRSSARIERIRTGVPSRSFAGWLNWGAAVSSIAGILHREHMVTPGRQVQVQATRK